MTTDQIRARCKTDSERIVAYLWSIQPAWVPSHELQGRDTAFGFIGGAGAVRARELARGDCPDLLKGKIESEEGRKIGLDKRFTYFRYKQGVSKGARRDSDSPQTVLNQRSTGAV